MNNAYINENNSIYNDIRNTHYMLQYSNNRALNNPFSLITNNNYNNNYQKNKEENFGYNFNERYTVAAPFPSDSLLDFQNTNNTDTIHSGSHSKIPSSVRIKKIKVQREGRTITNNSSNNLKKPTIFSDNNKTKRQPMDDISNSSYNNINISNSSAINNNDIIKNNIFNKDNININKNINKAINDKNNNNIIFNNKRISDKNVNNNNNNNQKINQYIKINNNNNNYNSPNYNNNNSNNNARIKNIMKNSDIQNQFVNRNNSMLSMLKKIQFFEKLNKIGEERMKIFENEFQKDTFFMKKDFFDNTIIKESIIDNNCPLILIFHYIFNPQKIITQYSYKKSFFESIFQLRGDKNIKIIYNPNDIKYVPKYFNDFNYVNNLFNNFNEKELNTFISEIEKWTKTFTFELQYVHPFQNNIGQSQIETNDVVKIYFVSPNDLIVDYHSYANNSPLSDTFVSISQYNFHCDIKYDKKSGIFVFKTSANVYNKLQIIKENIIQNVIKQDANNIYSVELPIYTWKQLLNIITEEGKKNKIISDKIFKEHIRNTLNKYSKNKPQLNYEEEKSENIKDFNDFKSNKNNIQQKIETNIINDDMNENQKSNKNVIKGIVKNERVFTFAENFNDNQNINNNNINLNNIIEDNNVILENENKINDSNNNSKDNNKENIIKDSNEIRNNINNNNKENNIKNDNEIKNNINRNNKSNKEEVEENSFLFYGVLITFFLFIFKTVLGIESGTISSETFFNLLIIIVIGFMLIKKYILDVEQQNRM